MKKLALFFIIVILFCTSCGTRNYKHDDVYSSTEALEIKSGIFGITESYMSNGSLKEGLSQHMGMGGKISCIYAKVKDTKYYLKENSDFEKNKIDGARVYAVEITGVAPNYNELKLKAGDCINIAYVSNSEYGSYDIIILNDKNIDDYNSIIKESGESIKLGGNTYCRLWLDKKYSYKRRVGENGTPFLRDGEEYALAIEKPDTWEGQDYYSLMYCYPKDNIEQAEKDNPSLIRSYFWREIYPQLINIIEDDNMEKKE